MPHSNFEERKYSRSVKKTNNKRIDLERHLDKSFGRGRTLKKLSPFRTSPERTQLDKTSPAKASPMKMPDINLTVITAFEISIQKERPKVPRLVIPSETSNSGHYKQPRVSPEKTDMVKKPKKV